LQQQQQPAAAPELLLKLPEAIAVCNFNAAGAAAVADRPAVSALAEATTTTSNIEQSLQAPVVTQQATAAATSSRGGIREAPTSVISHR
jgi:hypothetical protein